MEPVTLTELLLQRIADSNDRIAAELEAARKDAAKGTAKAVQSKGRQQVTGR